MKFLATGLNGNQPSQTFLVTYSDGTKTSFTQSLSDWHTPQNYAGESTASAMSYRDNSIGTRDGRPFFLYSYSLALNTAKTVSSVTLPANRNVVILAMTLTGSAASAVISPVDLSKAFNGLESPPTARPSLVDWTESVAAYSGSLLGGTQTVNNLPFQLGAANSPNVVSASTSPVALSGGQYSSLAILATAVNGAVLAQPFKVTYSDGTSITFTQNLSDWFKSASYPGETTALTMPYRNFSSGVKDNRTFMLYQYTFPLDATKTVSSLTLPASSNVKVFALTLKP